jgi:xanthine dehydrogenase small subunit
MTAYDGGAGASAPRIVLNGVPVTVRDVAAMTTLLDWLRETRGLHGTKEGCAEGDCGACTVLVERRGPDGAVRRDPINACLTMIGQVDGYGIRTVEGMSPPGGRLHPVQRALASGGGTQCGFCTPGFVMSAYAFAGAAADVAEVHDALAGNLCRCTGYRPILDAIATVTPLADDPLAAEDSALLRELDAIARDRGTCFANEDRPFHVPRSLAEAVELRAHRPQALLLAGGTDLGLLASRQRQRIPEIIHLAAVPELSLIKDRDECLAIGAGVTYARALGVIARYYPSLTAYLTRLGSRQIRTMGTIGGNLGTASPIGDFLPILLALDATIALRSIRGARTVAAADFFLGYRKTALAADELIEAVLLPKPDGASQLFVDKISKRRDQDISSVCAAYRVATRDGIVADVRLAYGGLAATPKRAVAAEAALRGTTLDDSSLAAAEAALRQDFAPLSDWRGSAEYRMLLAGNLLRRLQLRLTGPAYPLELDAL